MLYFTLKALNEKLKTDLAEARAEIERLRAFGNVGTTDATDDQARADWDGQHAHDLSVSAQMAEAEQRDAGKREAFAEVLALVAERKAHHTAIIAKADDLSSFTRSKGAIGTLMTLDVKIRTIAKIID